MSTLQPVVTLDARHAGQLVQVPSFNGPTVEGHLQRIHHDAAHRQTMLVLELTANGCEMLRLPAMAKLNHGPNLAIQLPWMMQVVLTPAGMAPSLG